MNLSGNSAVALKTKRPMRSMSVQSKLEAIRRVHAGESKASVARNIGVPESTLRGWCKNEEKILYLSRQSSPETDGSLEQPQPKQIKLEEQRTQPFDFSTKINGNRPCSPDVALDYSKSGPNSPNQPLNMTARMETSKTPTQACDTSEREGALFARRLQLGLNGSQFQSTSSSNIAAHQDDLNASVMAQWRAIMMQQQQKLSLRTAPVDTSNMACSSGGLLAIANQENVRYLPMDSQSAHDSVWNWLKSQHLIQSQAQLGPQPAVNDVVSPTSTMNGMNPAQSSLIWKWYEQALAQQIQQMSAQDPATLFSQQVATVAQQNVSPPPQPPASDQDSENVVESKNRFDRNHKGKMLLDNLLFNGTSVKQEPLDDQDGTTRREAMKSGYLFLGYLETNNVPGINEMHISEYRKFLNKLSGSGDKKNCEIRNKRK